ncbi:amidohydrolase [Clathrospora elynae]|uniref:Amidohydrolase n=1 Tax=Clathrospora elynae TaxID=706981 RepID=A0A6A5SAP9_9PLEO|nr:amidohydrolase [Clathrospora elynae]
MEKHVLDGPPTYTDATTPSPSRPWQNRRRKRRTFRIFAVVLLTYLMYCTLKISNNAANPVSTLSMERLKEDYATCSTLSSKPTESGQQRSHNKRWVNTTRPLLIHNATVWTGEPAAGTSEEDARAGKGWAWVSSDVFVDRGLIWSIESAIDKSLLPDNTEEFDAKGRQLTAGIVDMHSHAGLGAVANLGDDTNELSSDITPYIRSIDGIDPLQPEIEFIKSGGVTTSLFLPGSGNNMGGEAFVLKFAVGPKSGRTEISQQDMLADPDKTWRYMKMACGENAKHVFGRVGRGPFSRLGEAWQFRHAFEQARKYVQEQDDWCAAADTVGVENMAAYLRQELEWESLGAVLRGQVRVNTHCYTAADLEAFVRHTNEFKFRVYAFHHAHQTYLVPEVLKRAWGGTPAAALFADNMYYKVESYTASERAGAILYAHNITPTYVSDNPVLNSQHVVFEAAKAYRNGLPYHAALAGVTSAPAGLLGLGERIGKIKLGFDADLVVWDSDPLSVGATPVQVWIDGAKQFEDSIELKKPNLPPVFPNQELEKDLEREDVEDTIVFTGISHVHHNAFSKDKNDAQATVAIVSHGKLSCVGPCTSELETLTSSSIPPKTIVLRNGYLTPPLTAFGTALGLQEIDNTITPDTHDGPPPESNISFASDGLSFGGKQLAAAYAHGVTRAISAPTHGGIDSQGISVGFYTGAKNRLENGAIWSPVVALHYPLTLAAKKGKTPSTSSAVTELKTKLLDAVDELAKDDVMAPRKDWIQESHYLKKIVQGELPLVLSAHSADTIASIIKLKDYIESAIASYTSTSTTSNTKLQIVIIGGAEAHLVATELAAANISVVLAPMLPHAQSWDQRRGLTGPPLTNVSTNVLLDAGVRIGISVDETWESRDLVLLAGIAYANSEERLSFGEALNLVGGNIDEMLGIEKQEMTIRGEWVIWEGSPLEICGRVRGIGGAEKTSLWT